MPEQNESDDVRTEHVYIGQSELSFADAAQKAAKKAFRDNDGEHLKLSVVKMDVEITNPITMYVVLKPSD